MCPSSGEFTVSIRHWYFFTLYGWLCALQTRQPPIQSEKYQCRTDTINSPDDGHTAARNMLKVTVKCSRYRPGVAQRVGRGIALLFHDAALEGGEWSAAHPGRTLPRERLGTHFTGGWVGPWAGLDGRKISSPPGFDPGPSSP